MCIVGKTGRSCGSVMDGERRAAEKLRDAFRCLLPNVTFAAGGAIFNIHVTQTHNNTTDVENKVDI